MEWEKERKREKEKRKEDSMDETRKRNGSWKRRRESVSMHK